MRELYHAMDIFQAKVPETHLDDDAVIDGLTCDLQGFDSALAIVNVGAEGDTLAAGLRLEFFLEHADDDGTGSPDTWAAVPDAEITNPITSAVSGQTGTFAILDAVAEAPSVHSAGYIGGKRFLRVQQNNVGTHASGTPTSAVIARGHASFTPND